MKGFTAQWGRLPQLQLPSYMFPRGILTLGQAELRVLLTLLHIHKSQFRRRRHDDTEAKVKVRQERLRGRTGYRRLATISDAVHSLQESGFVQIHWDRKGSTKRGAVSAEYTLTHPETREPLSITSRSGNILAPFKIPYFSIPVCVLTSAAPWSLAKLTGPEVKLYLSILWIGTVERSHQFQRTHAQLYRTATLTPVTFKTALQGLRRHGLVSFTDSLDTRIVTIQICDPFTGELMHKPNGEDEDDPANYFTTDDSGATRRFTWNGGTDAEWAQLVRDALPEDKPITTQSNGDLMIRCPFPSHNDSNPSCSASPHERVFQCFGCGRTGTLTGLLAAMTGSKGNAIKRIAKARGQVVEFHQPDSKAVAKYDYLDTFGNPRMRKLRFEDEQGKRFSLRKWTDSGWAPGTKGLGPMLYNAQWLRVTGTVIIVEGEKDANSITDLNLCGYGGMAIGMTSGGKGSWHPKLARQLKGKVVIVMPDNDAPGETYAESVRDSLEAEHIDYKSVSFAGTDAKDVTEYLSIGYTVEDLVELIDSEWVRMPDGSRTDKQSGYPFIGVDTILEGEVSI